MTAVRMLQPVTGTRNGEEWPAVGGTVEVTDDEAMMLLALGLAELLGKA